MITRSKDVLKPFKAKGKYRRKSFNNGIWEAIVGSYCPNLLRQSLRRQYLSDYHNGQYPLSDPKYFPYRNFQKGKGDGSWLKVDGGLGQGNKKIVTTFFLSLRWPPKMKLIQHKNLLIYHSFKCMQYDSTNIQIINQIVYFIKNQTWSNMWSNNFWQTQGHRK